ncbi:hypothetical protein [Halochromatium roseum]|uniref:hypothetical protein n=1 Tax=Halochromatium roseum TaxID=391920 RepID=UPI001913D813|nr:hypothetical protein [Halochromatium roseum]
MTPEQHTDLELIALGLRATLDAIDMSADREQKDGLFAGCLYMSKQLVEIVNAIDRPAQPAKEAGA